MHRRCRRHEQRLLVDPERIVIAEANRGKGKNAIGTFAPSNDLKYVAVTITPGALPWPAIEIRHRSALATGVTLSLRDTENTITRPSE
jgi:hypothetical protein